MSVQTDLEKRTVKLQGILDDTNEALAEKNAPEADSLAGIPAAVRAIETKQDLQLEDVYIEPSEELQVVEPSKGYDGIGSVTVYPVEIPVQDCDFYYYNGAKLPVLPDTEYPCASILYVEDEDGWAADLYLSSKNPTYDEDLGKLVMSPGVVYHCYSSVEEAEEYGNPLDKCGIFSTWGPANVKTGSTTSAGATWTNTTIRSTDGSVYLRSSDPVPFNGLVLEDVYITPTTREQTVYPSEGYDGIGSVTVGAAEAGGGGTAIPAEYQDYVNQAKCIYTGEYTDLAIADNGKYVSVMFLTSDFAITEYDPSIASYRAIGIVFVTCVKATGAWDDGVDHTTTPSTGTRFLSSWVYCSRPVTYNGAVIWQTAQPSIYASAEGWVLDETGAVTTFNPISVTVTAELYTEGE